MTTDEHNPFDDTAARVADQFRQSFARRLAVVMEHGMDAQIERLTDIAERFERKDTEMSDDNNIPSADIDAKIEARGNPTTLWGLPVVTESFNIDITGPILTVAPPSPLTDDEQAALHEFLDTDRNSKRDLGDESEEADE